MIDYIIIGSRALQEYSVSLNGIPALTFRKHKDVDVLVWNDESEKYCKEELKYDTIKITENIFRSLQWIRISGIKYAAPDSIYTLKCSHLGWDINWNKHKNDVLYLKSKGCKLNGWLYILLTDYWKEKNGNLPHLDFYKTKKDFFDDAVIKIYDHDYLHELVAYPNKPIYIDCLADGYEVLIDYDKFLALSEENKIRFFQEEIAVIAAERWLIPLDWRVDYRNKYSIQKAWELAVHKTIVALTKDWMTDFLIFNIEKFVKPNYKLFNKLIEEKVIMTKERITDEESEELLKTIYSMINNTNDNISLRNLIYDVLFVDEEYDNENCIFRIVERTGGEDQGTTAYTVIFWQDKTKGETEGTYYKFEYEYYSYSGFNFDDLAVTKVVPVSKTITVYE